MLHKTVTEFVRKPATYKLKFNNRRKFASHRLPFVGSRPDGTGRTTWSVPKTGGYFGGTTTGTALARLYLQYLRENKQDSGGLLQRIVLDMAQLENCDCEELNAFRGQIVGFFLELERWLIPCVKQMDDGLKNQDPKHLLKLANDGLSFDEEAWVQTLKDNDEEACS